MVSESRKIPQAPATSADVIDPSRLPRGPVTHKYIEVGKTLYQAPGETPRFAAKAAFVMLRELFRDAASPVTVYDPFCGNGVILLTALLFFHTRHKALLGSDLHPSAVRASRMNLRWLRYRQGLNTRIRAIHAYRTEDQQVKAIYAERCRLMFDEAKRIGTEADVFRQDARTVGHVLASVSGRIAIVADPPYAGMSRNRSSYDFGPLEPFLSQVADCPRADVLMLCYRRETPVLALLEKHFRVFPKRGTRGRDIYLCRRRSS